MRLVGAASQEAEEAVVSTWALAVRTVEDQHRVRPLEPEAQRREVVQLCVGSWLDYAEVGDAAEAGRWLAAAHLAWMAADLEAGPQGPALAVESVSVGVPSDVEVRREAVTLWRERVEHVGPGHHGARGLALTAAVVEARRRARGQLDEAAVACGAADLGGVRMHLHAALVFAAALRLLEDRYRRFGDLALRQTWGIQRGPVGTGAGEVVGGAR